MRFSGYVKNRGDPGDQTVMIGEMTYYGDVEGPAFELVEKEVHILFSLEPHSLKMSSNFHPNTRQLLYQQPANRSKHSSRISSDCSKDGLVTGYLPR